MHEMVLAVRDEMVAAYPELGESAERVAKVVLAEEEQFARTLAMGTPFLNQEIGAQLQIALDNVQRFADMQVNATQAINRALANSDGASKIMKQLDEAHKTIAALGSNVALSQATLQVAKQMEDAQRLATAFSENLHANPALMQAIEKIDEARKYTKRITDARKLFDFMRPTGCLAILSMMLRVMPALRLTNTVSRGRRRRSRLGLGLLGRVGLRSRRRRFIGSW